ncbi:MAG: class I SAM-dependent methyltransferase [Myxococcota bacterium]
MRVVDLDHDMSDVIPTGASLDSELLFRRMEQATFDALGLARGQCVLDSAAGIGQDDRALAHEGFWTVGAEPSQRMTALACLADAREPPPAPGAVRRVRAWSEGLPFRAGSFDAVFCKGALDHFDDPLACLTEMARVARPEGCVVLAVANFASLGCRLARLRSRLVGAGPPLGRRHFDVPSDHFTRYDAELLREQTGRQLHIARWQGVSLFWGLRSWTRLLSALPEPWARRLFALADALARRLPALADVIVVAGRPRSDGGADSPRPSAG